MEGQDKQHLEPLNEWEPRSPKWTVALTSQQQLWWSYYSPVMITAATVRISSVPRGDPLHQSTRAEPPPPLRWLRVGIRILRRSCVRKKERTKASKQASAPGSCVRQHVPSAGPASRRPHQRHHICSGAQIGSVPGFHHRGDGRWMDRWRKPGDGDDHGCSRLSALVLPQRIKAINRKPVGEFHNFLLDPGVSTLFSNWVTYSLLSQHSS